MVSAPTRLPTWIIWLQLKFVKRTLIILKPSAAHKFHRRGKAAHVMTSVQTQEEQRAERQHATQGVMNEPARGPAVLVSTSSAGYFILATFAVRGTDTLRALRYTQSYSGPSCICALAQG